VVGDALQNTYLNLATLKGLVHFGDFEQWAKLSIETGGYAKEAPGHFLVMLDTFRRGVAFYTMARRTKNGNYTRHANRIRKTVAKWLFLSAEQAALKKTKQYMQRLYIDR
jgi:hypothetical protein